MKGVEQGGDEPKKKQHRKKREKVAKKHKFKKNKKKFYDKRVVLRKIKSDKDEMRKLGLLSKQFHEKVHSDELLMVSRMLLKLCEHDRAKGETELLDLFAMIDDGCTINLRKMTDSYVQMKLHKIFGFLKLQHTKKNVLAFKKRASDLHANMSFTKLARHMITKERERKPESEPDDSSITDSSFSDCSDERKPAR